MSEIKKEGDMSLLKTILAFAGGTFVGAKGDKLMDAAIKLLDNPQTGGLAGLIQTFRDKGLDDAISSWIGTGENKPVSGEQVQEALDQGQIEEAAQAAGVSREEASSRLASLLPQLIDKLTPDGKLPEGDAIGQALAALKSKLMG
ncbi:MAG: YidB family protein [Gammaproteobacteria bacterium]